jgi:hypothetical protein
MSLGRPRLFRWRLPRTSTETSLNQVFARCLQWVYDTKIRFIPFAADGRTTSLGVKAFGELAFCLSRVLQLAPDQLRTRTVPLAHWVLDTVADCAFGSLLAEEPQLLPMFGVLELLEVELGVEGRLSGLPTRRNLSVYTDARNLDGWAFQDLGTARSCCAPESTIQEIFSRTLISRDPQLACLSDLDTYAITHALFSVSGISGELPSWLDVETVAAMQWTIEVLVGMSVRSDDLDLLAELVVCHSILRCLDQDVAHAAWRRLSRAQDPSGFVPGPEHNSTHQAALGRAEQLEFVFQTSYHTTLATLLAASLALARSAGKAALPGYR